MYNIMSYSVALKLLPLLFKQCKAWVWIAVYSLFCSINKEYCISNSLNLSTTLYAKIGILLYMGTSNAMVDIHFSQPDAVPCPVQRFLYSGMHKPLSQELVPYIFIQVQLPSTGMNPL